jgi:hypothetical protein
MAGRWVDVSVAARELGISTDAVRKRIARGSLLAEREDGSVRVWLDAGGTEAGREAQVDREALIEAKDHAIRILEDQLREEREARRRADTIIAQLTQANAALAQRIPELEAPASPEPPSEPRESSSTSSETATDARIEPTPRQEPVEEPAERRSWWRRVLGR